MEEKPEQEAQQEEKLKERRIQRRRNSSPGTAEQQLRKRRHSAHLGMDKEAWWMSVNKLFMWTDANGAHRAWTGCETSARPQKARHFWACSHCVLTVCSRKASLQVVRLQKFEMVSKENKMWDRRHKKTKAGAEIINLFVFCEPASKQQEKNCQGGSPSRSFNSLTCL